jgi:hypothetical protein
LHLEKKSMTQNLLTEVEAAKILGKSVSWMQRQRWMQTGPAFIRIGRNCRYQREMLDKYIVECFVGTNDQQVSQ